MKPFSLDPSMFSLAVEDRHHQFRNESELKTEAKGGYIRGRIALPPLVPGNGCAARPLVRDFTLELSVSAGLTDAKKKNEHELHPNLLVASGERKYVPKLE